MTETPSRTQTLSKAQARRIAIAAQGFLDPAHTTSTMRTLERTVSRTGVLQVDSVNVLQRAHFMPLYSRMGPYDEDLLRRASQRKPRRLIEYWAHVQALMPVDLWPVMRHRMDHYRAQRGRWFSARRTTPASRHRCWPSSASAAPARHAISTTAFRARRTTGDGTGPRRARCSTSCTWSVTWRSPVATASSR